jgi:hypothetical protein
MTKLFGTFIFLILFSLAIFAQEETVAASGSDLTGIALPAGAVRVQPGSVPAEITQSLDKLVAAGGDKIRPGDREVLAWANNFKKANSAALIKKFTGNLQTSGWTYEKADGDADLTIFTLTRNEPEKRALLGFYTFSDEAFVLAWTEIVAADSGKAAKVSESAAGNSMNNSSARVLNVPKGTAYINVMGNEMPAMPKFPALAAKPGRVRGYVKDASGKPLPGATIGVRSTLLGGMYSGAQGKTDANGYYDFAVPRGVAHYYNAGYAIEYGDGIAAIGLHPADGSIDSFASVDGAVENFVMLSYGITSRANLSENPRLPATYYGGSVYIGCFVIEQSDAAAQPTAIVDGTVIEVTLAPQGSLADGSAGTPIVVRKTAGFEGGFWINNIPIGTYTIGARLGNGKQLKISMNRPAESFGINPKTTTSSASLWFKPSDAKASMVTPGAGAWDAVSLSVSQP